MELIQRTFKNGFNIINEINNILLEYLNGTTIFISARRDRQIR